MLKENKGELSSFMPPSTLLLVDVTFILTFVQSLVSCSEYSMSNVFYLSGSHDTMDMLGMST